MNQKINTTNRLAIFRGKEIRKKIYKNEWWFSVNDIIEVLTDSRDPAQYFKRLKERDEELAELIAKGGVQFVPPLMLGIETPGGIQKAYCWDTEGIFRLIQSIPSPKAEPFKSWLARVRKIRASERNLYDKVKDIFGTSIDYDPKTDFTKECYVTMQKKLK